MNQKDYDAIAKIIVMTREKFNSDNPSINSYEKTLINDLADYFEEQAQLMFEGKLTEGNFERVKYNRKDFLKKCGVEE